MQSGLRSLCGEDKDAHSDAITETMSRRNSVQPGLKPSPDVDLFLFPRSQKPAAPTPIPVFLPPSTGERSKSHLTELPQGNMV